MRGERERLTSILQPGTASAVGRRLTPEPERELPQDPVRWVQDELGEHVWSKSRELMRSVVEHRHTAVPAGHDVSKSWAASRLAAWWIAAHEPGDAFVVTSAPSEAQVKAVLWREISRAHRLGGLPGRITLAAQWYIGPQGSEELVAFGRKPADLVDKEQAMQQFAGIHARYVLVLLDEAMGIPGWLWDAAESLATNEASRILAVGNPDSPSGQFAEVCKPGSGWNVIPISVFDSPNFTGEVVPEHLRELLVSKTWEEERRQRWGVDNPLYQSKVLAQFPDVSDDLVISPALIRAARERELPGTGIGAFGLDVARFGGDESVLYRVRDGVVRRVDAWRKTDTVTTKDRALGHTRHLPRVPLVIDTDGIGGSVFDMLKRERPHVAPFSMAGPVHKPFRFSNRRSEIWWAFREEMEAGLIDLDPADDEIAAQLQMPKWESRLGKIRVETKEEMAKRGLPSPDHADAAIMARFGAPPAMPGPNGYATGVPEAQMQTAGLRKRPM